MADGFSLASEQKIIYFPFYQKEKTLFLMGGKVCLSLGLSLDPPISNLKENFYYGLKKNIYEITHSKLMGGLNFLCSTFPLSCHQIFANISILSCLSNVNMRNTEFK
jgi:hypothetical protein